MGKNPGTTGMEQYKVIAGMVWAWCFFFGMGWMLEVFLTRWFNEPMTEDAIIGKATIAGIMTSQ